jgi:hypothetical protein
MSTKYSLASNDAEYGYQLREVEGLEPSNISSSRASPPFVRVRAGFANGRNIASELSFQTCGNNRRLMGLWETHGGNVAAMPATLRANSTTDFPTSPLHRLYLHFVAVNHHVSAGCGIEPQRERE